MKNTDTWNWALTSPKGQFTGAVIPVAVIDEAPGNADTFYAAQGAAFSITVRKGATP